jgi:hypothetical protein
MTRPLYGLALAIAFLAPTAALRPQAAGNADQFAVATIRPSRVEEGFSVVINGRRFSTTQASLKDLITYAYMLHSRQISGRPVWLETDKL